MTIQEVYQAKCNDNSDICQHLPTLKFYAEKCDFIVELGVRSIVSTWAFLAAKPLILLSVDIHHPSHYKDYDPEGCNLDMVSRLSAAQGTEFHFILHDSVDVKFPECDLIFFDTLHTSLQLSLELESHGNKARKYLIFHDTETYKEELVPVIDQFMVLNNHWKLVHHSTKNNGLMVLGRQ